MLFPSLVSGKIDREDLKHTPDVRHGRWKSRRPAQDHFQTRETARQQLPPNALLQRVASAEDFWSRSFSETDRRSKASLRLDLDPENFDLFGSREANMCSHAKTEFWSPCLNLKTGASHVSRLWQSEREVVFLLS